MIAPLLLRTLYEKRWFFMGWSIVFTVMTTLIVMFYPSFNLGPSMEEVIKTIPPQFHGMIGNPKHFHTIEGFIASQIYTVRMPLLIMIMGLLLATALTLREEESGEMKTLNMLSLSRTRILLEKWFAGWIIIIGLNLVAVAGTYVGIMSLGESYPHDMIWRLMLLSTLFGIIAFTIPFSIGIATGRRALTLFVGIVVTIGSFLLTTFAKSVDWLRYFEVMSLMHYYDVETLREGHFDRLDLWALVLIGIAAFVLMWASFRRRDLTN